MDRAGIAGNGGRGGTVSGSGMGVIKPGSRGNWPSIGLRGSTCAGMITGIPLGLTARAGSSTPDASPATSGKLKGCPLAFNSLTRARLRATSDKYDDSSTPDASSATSGRVRGDESPVAFNSLTRARLRATSGGLAIESARRLRGGTWISS